MKFKYTTNIPIKLFNKRKNFLKWFYELNHTMLTHTPDTEIRTMHLNQDTYDNIIHKYGLQTIEEIKRAGYEIQVHN